MSTVVNDRDALLQSAPVRSDNPKQGKSLLISASSSVFKITDGVAAPAAIAINVSLIGLNGAPVIKVVGASRLIGSAGLTRTLDYADVTSDVVEVTATLDVDGQTYTATQTIVRVTDGKNGVSGLSTAQVFAYKRSAQVPADGPGNIVYSFVSASITSPAGNDLGNGWSKLIPTGNDPLYARVASASGAGDTDNIAAGEFSEPVLMLKNGVDGGPGKNGINSATVYIYQRTDSPVPPALPKQPVIYTFDPPSVSGLTGGWATVVPTGSGRYLHVSSGTAASAMATDTINPGEWAGVQLLAKNGDEGLPGKPGSSVGKPRAYQWSLGGAPGIYGTSTYTWSTGTYDAPPTGWSSVKPAPPSKGATLYEAEVILVNQNAAQTSDIDWGTASLSAVGYVGLDGQPGTGGPQGASALIAYCLIDGNSLNSTPAFALVTGYNVPTTGTWGESRSWQLNAPIPAAGQSVFQSNGIFNPATGNTLWSTPYLANQKVGSLSAISAFLGKILGGEMNIGNGRFVVGADGSVQISGIYPNGQVLLGSNGLQLIAPNGVVVVDISL